jgi:hypothetical protein
MAGINLCPQYGQTRTLRPTFCSQAGHVFITANVFLAFCGCQQSDAVHSSQELTYLVYQGRSVSSRENGCYRSQQNLRCSKSKAIFQNCGPLTPKTP